MKLIKIILSNPLISFGIITLMSIIALASAFTAEHVFGLQPCNLCIYQRYPFVIGAALGIIGLVLSNNIIISRTILTILGLNFLINSAIAFYHTGVEQAWWESAFEGCKIIITDGSKSLLDSIMGTPLTSCTDVQWIDPIIGLSMANYNIAFCFGLFAYCLISAVFIRKTQA